MFREMRRFKQALTEEECVAVLKEEKRATFAVHGEDGYPYALPINYWYDENDGCIYFHCAKEGHKLDAIKADDKVCFTVWQEGPQEPGEWWYHMKSVICFGRAEVMEDGDEKFEKARNFGAKYFPTKEYLDEELAHSYARVNMVRIRIDHMTGKRVKEN